MNENNGISSGFTLIELLIVVAIVGILAKVAYPAYQSSVQKSNRAGAKTLMLQIVQQEERYYTENNKYVPLTTLGYSASTVYSDKNTHAITLAAGSTGTIDTSYVLTATPQSTDAKCGNLTLNSISAWGNSAGATLGTC